MKKFVSLALVLCMCLALWWGVGRVHQQKRNKTVWNLNLLKLMILQMGKMY